MKNLKFYLIIIGLAIAATWLAIICYDQHEVISTHKKQKYDLDQRVQTDAAEVSRKVDSNGIERTIFDITNNITTHDEVDKKTGDKDIIDTTAAALDIRTKQLTEVTVINAQIKAENIKLKSLLDSNKRRYYAFNQNGFSGRFLPPINPEDSTDLATADIYGKFSLTAAQYFKKKWFLGEEKNYLSITSNSPFFSIDKVSYIGFDRAPKQSGLRLQAEGSYNPLTGPSGGPAIRVDLGRLNLKGSYQYYLDYKDWHPEFNVSFDIKRF